MEELERRRIESDPVYHVLLYPHEQHFLDTLLEAAIEIVKKKYGNHVITLPEVAHAFELLQSSSLRNDSRPRLFALLFMMVWEPSLTGALCEMYGPNAIFGKQHLSKYVMRIKQFVESTLSFRYNETNIVTIVENFVCSATTEYVVGPLTTNVPSSM